MEILPGRAGWPSLLLDPERRYDADAGFGAAERAGAWRAWKRVVASVAPQALIRLVEESGLRGRGGAGFPTGEKWRVCASRDPGQRYAVANGYEADPGALVDRTLMERDPHAVLEGLALAAYAVGASEAFVAVKATYSTALRRLRAAIVAAEDAGYLGANALGPGRHLQIGVREVQGGFVLGEETVLLRALENRRAMPDQRPPYPAERGLWGKPTVVNNVETLVLVRWIADRGVEAFAAATGGPQGGGTTLFQIAGSVARPGVVEAPIGTSLDELLAAAGDPVGRLKAVMVGGPSGGFIPERAVSSPLSWDALRESGAVMGSGSLLAVDSAACIVDLARLMQRFASEEACGKTIPCRIGTRRLSEIGERFSSGRSRPTDTQLAQDLAADIRDGALCALEALAPNPLLSGMRYFAEEFEDHIVRSVCPAGVCRPLGVAAVAAR